MMKELGSVCSGGRYNDLASFYTDKVLPGVGISIGLTRLYSKLKEINFYKNEIKSLTKVMVIDLEGGNMLAIASVLTSHGMVSHSFNINRIVCMDEEYAKVMDALKLQIEDVRGKGDF